MRCRGEAACPNGIPSAVGPVEPLQSHDRVVVVRLCGLIIWSDRAVRLCVLYFGRLRPCRQVRLSIVFSLDL